jgi:hypothetical protein
LGTFEDEELVDWESSLDAIDDVDERKEEGEPELRRKGKPKLLPTPLLALLLLLTGEMATTSGRADKGGS